jgi:FMN reductase
LNALTLPTTLYALEQDFDDYRLNNEKLSARIDRAAAEAKAQLALRFGQPAPQLAAAE